MICVLLACAGLLVNGFIPGPLSITQKQTVRHTYSPTIRTVSRAQSRPSIRASVQDDIKLALVDKKDVVLDEDEDEDEYVGPELHCARGICVLEEEAECIPTPDGDGCMPPTPLEFWFPRVLMLTCAMLYGTNFPLGRLMCESTTPAVASGLRFSLAALALSPFLPKLDKSLIRPAFECGLFVAFGYIGQSIALESTTAATVGFICALAVVVCPILEGVFDGKKIALATWGAAALALVGVGLLELGDSTGFGVGDLWAFTQPIGFGVAFWKTEKMMSDYPDQTLPITAMQVAVAGTTSLAWLLLEAGGVPDSSLFTGLLESQAALAAIAWTGLVTTALNRLGETTALGKISSSEASVLLCTEPLWAAVFAYFLLGEAVGPNDVVGGLLIIAACLGNALLANPDEEQASLAQN